MDGESRAIVESVRAPAVAQLHICFVAHNAFGAITGGAETHAGGIERQQALMAKWLAKRGHRVAMVTWDEGQSDGVHEGVEIFKLCRRQDGVPGLRFFHPRWTSLNRALARANAPLYYYNCGDLGLGQIARWTKAHGRTLVYSVAADVDCVEALPALTNARERILYRQGLRLCDHIITQTRRQQQTLEQDFKRSSSVLSMPCEGYLHVTRAPQQDAVVWVGRISHQKRLECLLDIAELLPHRRFEVIGAPNSSDSDYAREMIERARKIPNVALLGRVPYREMGSVYARAAVLCSTSRYEGFPNVYLEAWSAGIPIVSAFDPDDLIKRYQLGRVTLDARESAEAIEQLMTDGALRAATGERARAFFREYHELERAMSAFEELFARVAR
jgi:glycosyltransferase involved in cell wall biosynthesis